MSWDEGYTLPQEENMTLVIAMRSVNGYLVCADQRGIPNSSKYSYADTLTKTFLTQGRIAIGLCGDTRRLHDILDTKGHIASHCPSAFLLGEQIAGDISANPTIQDSAILLADKTGVYLMTHQVVAQKRIMLPPVSQREGYALVGYFANLGQWFISKSYDVNHSAADMASRMILAVQVTNCVSLSVSNTATIHGVDTKTDTNWTDEKTVKSIAVASDISSTLIGALRGSALPPS